MTFDIIINPDKGDMNLEKSSFVVEDGWKIQILKIFI